MKKASATIILALLLAANCLLIGGDACDKVPSMTREEACLKACSTSPQLSNLCRQTLQSSPETAEVTAYAAAAARFIVWSYDATVAKASQLVANGAPRDEREAYLQCINSYAVARQQMAGITREMADCDFSRTDQEYQTAVGALQNCAKLLSSFKSSPVVSLNAADNDLTTVASDLGHLVLAGANNTRVEKQITR
ncbi:hypothetical protein ACP4OV_031986 [Aristida adscensionis]